MKYNYKIEKGKSGTYLILKNRYEENYIKYRKNN